MHGWCQWDCNKSVQVKGQFRPEGQKQAVQRGRRHLEHGVSALYALLQQQEGEGLPGFTARWEQETGLTLTDFDWDKIFQLAHKGSICSKYQECNYKILTCWYRNPDILRHVHKSIPGECWRCAPDDVAQPHADTVAEIQKGADHPLAYSGENAHTDTLEKPHGAHLSKMGMELMTASLQGRAEQCATAWFLWMEYVNKRAVREGARGGAAAAAERATPSDCHNNKIRSTPVTSTGDSIPIHDGQHTQNH
ncbi:Hypothetical predicted protein [Pelobates cultripes]|uniref:Uncharacterized protein n=1 Tax=Pelobates cultripes TaxID=61616 RepID=A0AAD1TIH4_PELCU|nr:Hypothetical predicted protein [Pelobates cultripes]